MRIINGYNSSLHLLVSSIDCIYQLYPRLRMSLIVITYIRLLVKYCFSNKRKSMTNDHSQIIDLSPRIRKTRMLQGASQHSIDRCRT